MYIVMLMNSSGDDEYCMYGVWSELHSVGVNDEEYSMVH